MMDVDTERLINRDPLPQWCRLLFAKGRQKGPCLVIDVQRDFLSELEPWPADCLVAKSMAQDFNLSGFCGDVKQGFGFGGSLGKGEARGGFVRFTLSLPRLLFREGVCRNCKGVGRSYIDEICGREKCYVCNGDGIGHIFKMKPANLLLANLAMLFRFVANDELNLTPGLGRQLLKLDVNFAKDKKYRSLGLTLTPPLVVWLKEAKQENFDRMNGLVKSTFVHFYNGLRSPNFEQLGVWMNHNRPGFIAINAPGNACYLGAGTFPGYEIERGQGYCISPHNLDDTIQMLLLLVGVFALSNEAEKEINNQNV